MSPIGDDSNPQLCSLIAERIEASPDRRITFAEYMEIVLYHPELGYYAQNTGQIGARGDFFTSPHTGAAFGELLSEQFVEMWRQLGSPPFTLVEMGAGQGLLAADVLLYLRHQHPDFFNSARYWIVEKSEALIREQKQRLSAFEAQVEWKSYEEIAPDSVIGCFFSNELVDAFPVHQFVVMNGRLNEIFVTVQDGEFAEVAGPLSTPAIESFFARYGVDLIKLGNGYRSEVSLAALEWVETVAGRLQKGYVLTIDYGYSAAQYYAPLHAEGTLQCYYRHTLGDNPYVHVGRQDITTHVNFTALEQHGYTSGLKRVGFTRQNFFLWALGLGERLVALNAPGAIGSNDDLQAALHQRQMLRLLTDPAGLGEFGVLIQSRGEAPGPLKGLATPA